jgi:AraC family transcriptional regulator
MIDSVPARKNYPTDLLRRALDVLSTDRELARHFVEEAAAFLLRDTDAIPAPAYGAACAGGLPDWKIRRVVGFIEKRIGSKVMVADLARECGISNCHFSRAFKMSFGQTLGGYLRAARVGRAKYLMQTTDDSLSQIAIDCGFCDQAHLCRSFVNIVGVTPHSWRRNMVRRPRVLAAAPFQYPTPTGPLKSEGIPRQTA